MRWCVLARGTIWAGGQYRVVVLGVPELRRGVFPFLPREFEIKKNFIYVQTIRPRKRTVFSRKKIASSSMLHEAKIAYYAFDVIVYCMYTHQTRIAYKKRTH